jgi:SAM-dependent methyltransferase
MSRAGGDSALPHRHPGPGRSAQVLSTYERAAARYDRVWRRLWLQVAGGSAENAMLDSVVRAASTMDDPRVLHAPRVVASVQALPFADETFDLVVSAWVIETVDSPRAAVKEMLRVLRPGGALVYSFCYRPLRRRDRWRSGPTRAVVHALFAGHFLREEQTPYHDCAMSRRSSFARGAATVIVLSKCCTIETGKERWQMPTPTLPCLTPRA